MEMKIEFVDLGNGVFDCVIDRSTEEGRYIGLVMCGGKEEYMSYRITIKENCICAVESLDDMANILERSFDGKVYEVTSIQGCFKLTINDRYNDVYSKECLFEQFDRVFGTVDAPCHGYDFRLLDNILDRFVQSKK